MDDYALWQAVLEEPDGRITIINQKDNLQDPSIPHYEKLPREKLRQFRMLTTAGDTILVVPFKPGQAGRLIWRRRVQMLSTGEQITYYVVGKRGGFVAVIHPDLSIFIDDKFSDDNVLLSEIDKVEGEE